MAIADRINEMYTHVGDVYDTITNVDVNTGKNLFDKEQETINTIINSAGTLTPNNDYNSSDFINIKSSTSIVLSTNTTSAILEIVEYDINKSLINRGVKTNSNFYTITTNVNTSYVRISYQNTSTQTQLEYGSSSTTYEPYTDNPTYKNIENISKVIRSSYLEIMNNGIDKIWNNWEKVTGSGTDISLSPTLEAPMRNVLNGNTYQFTTTGKNLMPNNGVTLTRNGITFTLNEDGSYILNGTSTAVVDYNICQAGELQLETGTYTLSSTNNIPSGMWLSVFVGSSDRYALTGGNTKTMTFSTATTNAKAHFYINSGVTINNLRIYPMIVSGTTVGDYEPYTGGQASPNPQYPQDIHVVSGDNSILVRGRQLWDENWHLGGIGSTGRDYDATTTSIRTQSYIEIGKGKTFFVTCPLGNRCYCFFYDKNKNYVYSTTIWIDATSKYGTYTMPSNATYLRIAFLADYGATYNNDIIIGYYSSGIDTSYEPYSSNSYNIDLPVENLLDLTSLVQRTSSTGVSNIQKNSFEQIGTGTWGNTYFYFKNDEKNTNYTISLKALSSLARRTGVSVYGGANTEASTEFTNIGTQWLDINANIQGSTSYSFNSGNYEYLMFRFWNNGTATALSSNVTLYMNDIQLEKGSKANSYTPFGTTPIELCDFNTYKDNFLRTSGKNLFDKDNANIVNAFINPTGYVLQANDNMRTLYIPCKPNTTYTVSKIQSARFVLGTSNTIEIGSSMTNGRNNFTATQLTITSGANDTYLLVFFYNGNADTLTPQQILDTIQIEEGTTATDYEPYGSGEWYTHKELGKAIIDENIVGGALTDSNQRIMFSSSSNPFLSNVYISTPSSASNLTPSLSNYFSSSAQSEITPTNNKVGFSKWGDTTFVYFSAIYNSVADFKTWLSTHNVVVYYVLATPNYNKITYEPLLEQLEAFYNAKSKNSQTNITQENNDLPFIIDSTMLKEV